MRDLATLICFASVIGSNLSFCHAIIIIINFPSAFLIYSSNSIIRVNRFCSLLQWVLIKLITGSEIIVTATYKSLFWRGKLSSHICHNPWLYFVAVFTAISRRNQSNHMESGNTSRESVLLLQVKWSSGKWQDVSTPSSNIVLLDSKPPVGRNCGEWGARAMGVNKSKCP